MTLSLNDLRDIRIEVQPQEWLHTPVGRPLEYLHVAAGDWVKIHVFMLSHGEDGAFAMDRTIYSPFPGLIIVTRGVQYPDIHWYALHASHSGVRHEAAPPVSVRKVRARS